jgi:CBS domain-containing protein
VDRARVRGKTTDHAVRGQPYLRLGDVTTPSGSYLTPRFEHATAADAMRPRVLTCSPETPLVTAAQRMTGEHVHARVIQRWEPDGARRPWAVLTDFDVLRNAAVAEELTAEGRRRSVL